MSEPEVITLDEHKDKTKQPRHWLIIRNNNEDKEQDDYFEDLEWEIEHSPDCPYEIVTYPPEQSLTGKTEVDKHYTCAVGFEVDMAGVDSLEFVTGTGDGWKELEPGRYEIRFWSQHSPSTPLGPEEWDGGLEFVDP